VHARGQVVHADIDPPPEGPERLARRLNGVLGDEVRVRRAVEAPEGFDARFSAIWRRYAYRVADRPELVDPLRRGHVLAWRHPVDARVMNAAALAMLGEHDFAAFCKQREGATTIRNLIDLRWERAPDGLLVAHVRADAFCHSMVRSLVGCLLAIGDGRRPVDWAVEVLSAEERDSAVTVAPAHGLTLEEVRYPPDAELAARVKITRARRG
jgi:tRNA pseudouridine38-40 synthase